MKFLRESAKSSPPSQEAHASIMQFRQMLLVFSVLVTLVYSFPTGSEQNNTISLAQNVTKTYDVPEDKPLTVIVEDKYPKSESVVVEFVYNSNGGNSISESKGTDKDKYTIDSSPQKETQDQIQNLSGKGKEKSAQKISIDITAQKQLNEPKLDSSHTVDDLPMKAQKSLMPEEISPLTANWPKYLHDVFNPIRPFPELQYEKPNQVNVQKIQRENADTYLPYYEKNRKEQVSVAGPLLSPLSIYEREFNVPIF